LRIKEAFALINFGFLLALLAGIGVAVVTLAPGIEWLLTNQPVLLWSFFFGLVIASVWMVSGKIKRWTPLLWIVLLLGTVGAYWLVGLVPTQTPDAWWFLIFSGAIAICAMILPGISGSFILVLLSKYEFFVSAVNQRDIVSLALAGIGAFVGLVSFAQVLSWLFKRYHDLTVALLTGFMIGSLRKVWPWKEVLETITDRHGELIPIRERNLLPPLLIDGAFNMTVLYALLLALAGFALVLFIERAAGAADSNDRTV
jgi:putative membrane protein